MISIFNILRLWTWPHCPDGEMVDLSWRAYPVLGAVGTLAVSAALFVLILWVGRDPGASLSRVRRWVLLSLRIAACLCLAPALLNLCAQVQLRRQVRPTLALAIDDSQSMSLADRYATPARQRELQEAIGEAAIQSLPDRSRMPRLELVQRMLGRDTAGSITITRPSEMLSRLNAVADLQVFAFDGNARGLDRDVQRAVGSLKADGTCTSLVNGIGDIVERLRGRPTAGILLFSDGANNTGGSPLPACEKWRQAGVPVYAIAIGDTDPKDIEVRQVFADDLLFLGDPATIIVRLRQHGYAKGRVPLVVGCGRDSLARLDVDLPPDGIETNIPVTFTPTQPGEQIFRVSCPVQPDEAVEQNNQKTFVAKVTSEKLRVLCLEGKPRWQYRFLRDAMTRDHRIALQVLLAGAESVAEPVAPMIASLPTARTGFEPVDVFMLGDIDPAIMTTEQMEWIQELVRDKAAGIVLLAGPEFNPAAYAATPLADVFPVEAAHDASRPAQRPRAAEQDRFVPDLTAIGQRHPAVQIADDFTQNTERWKSLLGVYWCAPLHKARPGASVLAVHPRERLAGSSFEPLPVIAVQQFGRGRTFYCGMDETWRWRFTRGDQIFYRLWSQVLLYVGVPHMAGGQGGLTLRTDRGVYGRGETALVTVRAEDWPAGQIPTVVAESDDGRQNCLVLSPSPGAEQLFEARLPLTVAGACRLWVEGHAIEASTVVQIEAPQLELQEPAANDEILKAIADQTRGHFARPGQFAQLLDQIDLSPRRIQEECTLTLWDTPFVIGLFVLLLGTEWVLRRLWQLP